MTRPKYNFKPFPHLTNKQRAIFVLHLAKFSHRQIKLLLGTGSDYTSQAISKGYEENSEITGTKSELTGR